MLSFCLSRTKYWKLHDYAMVRGGNVTETLRRKWCINIGLRDIRRNVLSWPFDRSNYWAAEETHRFWTIDRKTFIDAESGWSAWEEHSEPWARSRVHWVDSLNSSACTYVHTYIRRCFGADNRGFWCFSSIQLRLANRRHANLSDAAFTSSEHRVIINWPTD
jgi:hypothetical protein